MDGGGKNVSIRGEDLTNLFEITGGVVTIKNLTLPTVVIGSSSNARLSGSVVGDLVNHGTLTVLGDDVLVDNRVPEFTSQIEPVINPSLGSDADRRGVYLPTGEYTTAAIDLAVPSRGIDFVLARTYRSGVLFHGVMGQGWDHNYNYRLVETTATSLEHVQPTFANAAPGDVARMDGAGRADLYTQNVDGSYTAPVGLFTRLTRNNDGTFTERYSDGTRLEFQAADADGLAQMESITDRNDNQLNFFYNEGRLTCILDVYDRSYDFFYDDQGHLVQLTDFDGRSVTYQYDSEGNLISVTSPSVTGTSTDNDFVNGRTWQYGYSSGRALPRQNHNLLSVTAPNEVAAGGPARLMLSYDATDQVIRQVFGGTNPNGVPAGGTWQYTYASLADSAPGNPDLAVDQTTVVDANGNQAEYGFNTLGNTLRVAEFSNRDIRSSDPDSFVATHQYNTEGQRVASTLPAGNSIRWDFDDENLDRLQQQNLLSTTSIPDLDRGGDQAQLTTSWTYEPIFNQVRTTTDPRGNDTGYLPQNGGSQSAARYTNTGSFDYEEAFDLNAIGDQIGLTPTQVQALFDAAGIATTARGDLNNDGSVGQQSGNTVRVDWPTVNLLAGSNQATIEGDTTQQIVTLARFNEFGQLIGETDAEENVHTYAYYGAHDPDGDGEDLIVGNEATTADTSSRSHSTRPAPPAATRAPTPIQRTFAR